MDTARDRTGSTRTAAQWQALTDAAPVGMIVIDTHGLCTYSNPRSQEICGVSFDESLGTGWARHIHPSDRERVLRGWSAPAESVEEHRDEFRIVDGHGRERWANLRCAPLLEDGRHAGSIMILEDITERRAADEALADASSRLENALTVGEIATWVWDIQNDRMFADRNLARLFGVSAEHAAGGSLVHYVDAIHPDDQARVTVLVNDAVATAGGYEADYRVLSPDRGTRWVIVRGRVDTDTDGRPSRMHGVLMDITERKQAEQQLAASEQRFRDLADAMPQMVWISNADGGAEFFNQRWREYTGLSADAAPQDYWAALHPSDLVKVQEDWRQALIARSPFNSEHRFRRADGVYRWHLVRAVPVFVDQGQIVQWFGTCTDIHDAKLTEERLRAVIDATPECVKVVARDGSLVQMNPAGLSMIEAPDEASVCGASVFDLVAAEHRREWEALHARVCAGERLSWRFEVVGLRGTRRWMETHAVPMQLAGGEWAQLAVTRDVTTHKQYEHERETLLEAERAARTEAERASRLKDEFLTTLSHELRTPLNAILGWLRLLETTAGQAQLARGLEVITRNARLQAQIIDDLLDMSRIVSGKIRLDLRQIDLASVVELAVETARPNAEAKGVRLQTVLDPSAGKIVADPSRLQQVFWNLLSNAIKFTPRGGRIQMVLERVNSAVQVSVIDTGEGISSDFLPYVFDRFRQLDASTTRQHGGLGLGLSIAKQLVESHGGSIRAASEGLGRGSQFVVALPLGSLHLPEVPEPGETVRTIHLPLSEQPRLDGIRALVIDDDPDARDLVQRVLSDAGAAVAVAPSADAGIAACEAATFDILISDIGMPGQDGYTLIRRLRQLRNGNRDIPVVALTAYASSEDRRRALLSGYQAHLAKPAEPAELVAMVGSLVRRQDAEVTRRP